MCLTICSGGEVDHRTIADETGRTLTYDAWNRLVSVSGSPGVTHTYDALGRRIRETRGTTVTDLYYSDQWQVLEERTGSSKMHYVWSPVYVDAMVLRDRDANGDGTFEERLYAMQDANFNVTGLAETDGDVVERYVYDPYGAVTYLDGSWGTRSSSSYSWTYLHQGGRYDSASGLYAFRHREYSPTLGRWMQVDPTRYKGGDINLYRYVAGNPVAFLDPSGLNLEEYYVGVMCFTRCGVINPNTVYLARDAGERSANDENLTGNEHRAFRHCVAAGYLAKRVGCECADCLGRERENYQTKYSGQSERDRIMGLNNNSNGLGVAGCKTRRSGADAFWTTPCEVKKTSLQNIIEGCKEKLKNGELSYRNRNVRS
jgi:RHS repeat-associated protein